MLGTSWIIGLIGALSRVYVLLGAVRSCRNSQIVQPIVVMTALSTKHIWPGLTRGNAEVHRYNLLPNVVEGMLCWSAKRLLYRSLQNP